MPRDGRALLSAPVSQPPFTPRADAKRPSRGGAQQRQRQKGRGGQGGGAQGGGGQRNASASRPVQSTGPRQIASTQPAAKWNPAE